MDTLFPTEFLLVGAFDALFSDVVARLIIVILLDVGRRNLSHVPQDVCRVGVSILPEAAPLDVEAWKTIHLLLEDAEVFLRELVHEHLLGVG